MQTLPDNPIFAFTPAYEFPDQHQQIRIVFEGLAGYVPTALVALDLDQAEDLCDRLNSRLGLDREAWLAIYARSMHPPGTPDMRH